MKRIAISYQLSAISRRIEVSELFPASPRPRVAASRAALAPSPRLPLTPSHTTGATLLEVLMAMVVMAIGVLTVATLFPISVLRAVQATKLTNATIMRFNAQTLIDIDQRVVLDPDYDTDPPPAPATPH